MLKRHAKNTMCIGLDMIFFFSRQYGAPKHRGLKLLNIMLKDTKKYIGDVVGIRVENVLYFLFFQTKDHWKTW
jgi:hypothetical protein